MRQWEIYDSLHPDERNPHPRVVVSPAALAEDLRADLVNVLMCTSLRPGEQARKFEVRLNGKDGLDGPTLARCHLMLVFKKTQAGRKRGEVCSERRRAIQMKFKELFGFHAT